MRFSVRLKKLEDEPIPGFVRLELVELVQVERQMTLLKIVHTLTGGVQSVAGPAWYPG
jgi:hypothetical protein